MADLCAASRGRGWALVRDGDDRIVAHMRRQANSWRTYAELGQGYFIAIDRCRARHRSPGRSGGDGRRICLDRARGTLAHMLMTDLSDSEIVLGKLAARLLPVLGLVACTWPVMAISSLLGGIDPIALTLAFAIIVAVAVLGCSIALLFSVWARKSHEVILATYTVFILGILFWPIWYMLSMARMGRPARDVGAVGQPVLCRVRPVCRPRQARILGLSRLSSRRRSERRSS